jgi:hypothetical protein
VLENSSVTCPSHSGSSGVTLTIIPQREYVDFPKQITITFLGILKYSTVLAKAKLFGGIIQTSVFLSTKLAWENFFGSTTAESTFVNILK